MRLAALTSVALSALTTGARADEGMWPFDMVPRAQIKQQHNVDVDDALLEHLRLSSVRFSVGGSGSFVSGKGLVLTNHHVASDCIAKISSATHDFMEAGYLAGKDGGEVPCPDLELDVLQSTEDATDRVQSARTSQMSDAEANVAMKSQMTRLEQQCQDRTHLRCEMVTLYAGGQYHLYQYKRFTDVRLVFSPEAKLAFFGGDPDNFTFPRYDLDMALFRVYEGGRALTPQHFLSWSEAGPAEGDTVFVSGHPGSTGRLQTRAQLTTLRDVSYPYALANLTRESALLHAYSSAGREHERQAREPLFGVENSLKALTGYLGGLRDPALVKLKADDEAALIKALKADPKLAAKYGTTFDDIEQVQRKAGAMYPGYAALERGSASALLEFARHLVRMPAELAQPSDKRLREYRDSNLDSLKLEVLSPAAIYPGVEVALVRAWMENAARALAGKPSLLNKILRGKSPEQAARALVTGSRLFDVYARKQLFSGGTAAVVASDDPAVALMRAIDQDARDARKAYEDGVEAPMRSLSEAVAKATFAVRGKSLPPDATFTLRLSIGVVKGYDERGKHVPAMTDWAGMFNHATGKEPFALPPRVVAARNALTPTTSFNFVSTNDIIGGNSGSPVIAADGKIVGLIFDGNLSSLPNRFVYREVTERAVSVDTAAMTEALTKVYGAGAVVAELLAR